MIKHVSFEKVLIFFISILLIINIISSHNKYKIRKLPFIFLVGSSIFLIFYFLSSLVHPHPQAIGPLYRIILRFIFLFIVFQAYFDVKDIEKSIKVYFFTSIFVSFFTLYLFINSQNLFFIRSVYYDTEDKLSIIYGLGRLGAYNPFALWIALSYFLFAKKTTQKTSYLIFTFWFLFMNIINLGRERIVTIPISLFSLFILFITKNKKNLLKLSIVAISMISFISIMSFYFSEWQTKINYTLNNIGEEPRIVLMKYSYNVFRDYPLLGRGVGSFVTTQYQYSNIFSSLECGAGILLSHNTFFGILEEGGIICFIGLIIMLSYIGIRLIHIYKTRKDDQLCVMMILFFIMYISMLFFGNAFESTFSWFWLGIILSYVNLNGKKFSNLNLINE